MHHAGSSYVPCVINPPLSPRAKHNVDTLPCKICPAAAELVSDVANGGQVLIDEPTFLLVKDSLSLLGTVSEAGYDDRMLQRLNQARVVGRLQQLVACATACSR
jgi:hypothetical protein